MYGYSVIDNNLDVYEFIYTGKVCRITKTHVLSHHRVSSHHIEVLWQGASEVEGQVEWIKLLMVMDR